MVMVAAGRVEGGVARGAAGVALEVGGDGKLGATGAAEYGLFMPFGLGPGFDGVVGEGVVAVFTGVEEAAAFHFDGDDVERGVEVKAAGLGIEMEAMDFWGEWRHWNGWKLGRNRIAKWTELARMRLLDEREIGSEAKNKDREKDNAEAQRTLSCAEESRPK